MLYAVSEILAFMLLATLLGGAAGWWLARTDKVSVAKAMGRSGAHAAADRELESARAEIAQLTAKLAVATEAIRELETEGGAPRSIAAIPEPPPGPVELHAVEDDEPDAAIEAPDDAPVDDAGDPADDGPDAVDVEPAVDSGPVAASADAESRPGNTVPLRSKDRGGKRLSTRVAEASVVSPRERALPKIEFDDPAPGDD